MFRKGITLAVMLLFIGMSVIPSTGDIVSFDDITPPVTTCTLNPEEPDGLNGWYVSDVEVTLNATDDMSGVNVTEYRINGGSIQIYTEPFTVTIDGLHTVEYRSIDYAGNAEDWKSVEFKIDQTPPEIDLTWMYSPPDVVHFTATCNDATSGMDRVEFLINDELYFTDDSEPYEWIIEFPPTFIPPKYSVKGFIFGRQFDEQNVTFYALIVRIMEYLPFFWFCAIAYDMAGNSAEDELGASPPPPNIEIHFFKPLTFTNNYTGKIGFFFINAEFEEGPL